MKIRTWQDDIRDPAVRQAYEVVGDQPDWALANMIRALNMLRFLNTPEDEERLAAAKLIRRYNAKQRKTR